MHNRRSFFAFVAAGAAALAGSFGFNAGHSQRAPSAHRVSSPGPTLDRVVQSPTPVPGGYVERLLDRLAGNRGTFRGAGQPSASPNGGRPRPVTRGARHASLRSRSNRRKASARAKAARRRS